MTPTVGSLFTGIGGFDLGFERAGFRVAWHAEIEPHASAVLRRHWPNVPNAGDVSQIHGGLLEPVDVICGGFPCQDLSVAGKRAGIHGSRSSLAFQFLRIAKEMRDATERSAPAFVVLENVPGLLSSHGGRDFGVLLDALGLIGALDVAWRVVDSRFFGVAQRRRRVFVVADLGGHRAEEVLALRQGLRWDPQASRAAREDLAGTLGGGSGKCSWTDTDRMTFVADVAHTLACHAAKGGDPTTDNYVTHTPHQGAPSAASPSGVRRLMPVECERLQAFSDGWTVTGTRPDGSEYALSDSARYRCLGNAVTVNVAAWLARNLRETL